MQITIQELDQMLHRQGYRVVPYVNDLAEDVKMRPATQDDIIRGYDAAIAGLARLRRTTRPAAVQAEMRMIEDVAGSQADRPDCLELADLFTRHGSDKATTHNYHLLYGAVLSPLRDRAFSLLEIGLGTNNIDVLSNMGRFGKPGASLRAFRDWAPQARIFGADVDSRILFREERIETFFVDQTRPDTLEALAANFAPRSLDLIIDDGLHAPEANINTLLFALPLISDTGSIIIEDIGASTFPYWQTALSMLPPDYTGVFLRSKAACLIHIRRLIGGLPSS